MPLEQDRIVLQTAITVATRRLRALTYLFGVPFIWVSLDLSLSNRASLSLGADLQLLAVSIVVATAVLVGVEEFSRVGRIEITPSGIVFLFRLHRRSFRWDHLRPTKVERWRSSWAVVGTMPDGRELPFRVSIEQAQAILRVPWHQPWELSPETKAYLKVDLVPTSYQRGA